MTEQSPGWYPDPNDVRSEIYWDGARWHGRRQNLSSPSEYASIKRTDGAAATPLPNVIPAKWVLAWRGLAMQAKVIIVAAVSVFVIVLVAWLSTAPWESQKEKDCKAEVERERVPSAQFDALVDACVNFVNG